MKVFRGFEGLPEFKSPVATVGSYDGVHIGHRFVMSNLVETARGSGGESILLTLDPHPREVLYGEKVPALTTLDEKIVLLSHLGIDNLIVVPFTEEFSKLSSRQFIDQYIFGKLGVKKFYIGYDHRFGHKKEGDFKLLKELEKEYDFRVEMIEPFKLAEGEVSSTAIREFIEQGKMRDAERYLGYKYFFEATRPGEEDEEVKSTEIFYEGEEQKLFPPAGEYRVVVKGESRKWRKGLLELDGDGKMVLSFDEPQKLPKTLLVNFS